MKTKMRKSYTELIQIPDYEGRLNYLRLHGAVGRETFGYDRYLNQMLYETPEWRKVRRKVILRDKSCDMGLTDYEIHPHGKRKMLFVHHINPITREDILERSDSIFDPDNLVTVSFGTHQIIHYGYESDRRPVFTERTPNDMCPWRQTI